MFDDLHDPNPPVADGHHFAEVAERSERRRRRRRAAGMTTVVVGLVGAAGGLLTANAPDGHEPAAATTAASAAPPPTEPIGSFAFSSLSPAFASLPAGAAWNVPTALVERDSPLPDELAEAASAIAERTQSIDSFRAVTRQVVKVTDAADAVRPPREVVVRSDGALWADGAPGEWISYDPHTLTYRQAYRLGNGELKYSEIRGDHAGALAEANALGHPLMVPFVALTGDIVVDEATVPSLPDRPAWTIEQHTELVDTDGRATARVDVTYWVDKDTGLVLALEYTSSPTDGSGTSYTYTSQVERFETDAGLPAPFPGEFPADAPIERQVAADSIAAYDEADDVVAAFGRDVPVPVVVDGSFVARVRWRADAATVGEPGTAESVRYDVSIGFERVYLEVGQATTDQADAEPVGTVRGGALDGASFHPAAAAGSYAATVDRDGGGWSVTLSNVWDPQRAAELFGLLQRPR